MPASRGVGEPHDISAVIVGYKLMRGHPRTTRMARALQGRGCRVRVLGLTNAGGDESYSPGPRLQYALLPRFHVRQWLNQLLSLPLSIALRLLRDDLFHELATGAAARGEANHALAGRPAAGARPLPVRVVAGGTLRDEAVAIPSVEPVQMAADDSRSRWVQFFAGLPGLAMGVVRRLYFPTFPQQSAAAHGDISLSWLAPAGSSFVVEIQHIPSRLVRHIDVPRGRSLTLGLEQPGDYTWRVSVRQPASGWSRKLAFSVDTGLVASPGGRSLSLVEALFTVLWPVIPRNAIAWLLTVSRRQLRALTRRLPERLYRSVEIAVFSLRVARKLRRERVDLVIAHDLYALPLAWSLGRRRRIPYFYDVVELSVGRMREVAPGRLSRALIHAVERRARKAQAIIAGDPYLKQDFENRHSWAAPVVVLNGPSEIATSRGDELAGLCGLGKGERIVLYLGYLVDGRGLDKFVEAARHLPASVHCAIMGPGNAAYREALKALATRLRVADRVSILDAVDPDQIVRVASSADAGISPVDRGFGTARYVLNNKVFQYIAAGLPVLASDCEGVGRFVTREGIGLVFDEQDPASIAARIRDCFADEQRYAGFIAQTRRAAQKYAWSRQEQIFLESTLGSFAETA